MAFGLGVVTGFANKFGEGIEKSTKTYDDDKSQAKTFIAALKQSRLKTSTAEDKKATDQMKEFLSMANGNEKKAIMMSAAGGGTIDGNERLLTKLRDSQDKLGSTFNLFGDSGFFDFSNIDKFDSGITTSKWINSMVSAVDDIEVSPAMQPKNKLVNSIFGTDDSYDVMADVNSLLPTPSNLKDAGTVVDAPRAILNYDRLASAAEYKTKMAKNAPKGFDHRLLQILTEQNSIKNPKAGDGKFRFDKLEKEKNAIIDLEASVANAKKTTEKEKTLTTPSIKSIWELEMKLKLPKDLIQSVGDTIRVVMEGNEQEYFGNYMNVIKGVENTYSSIDNPILNNSINGEKDQFVKEFNKYINQTQVSFYNNSKELNEKSNEVSVPYDENKTKNKFMPIEIVNQKILKNPQYSGTPQEKMQQAVENNVFSPYQLIQTPNKKVIMWDGIKFIDPSSVATMFPPL